MTGIELWSTTAASNNSSPPNGWPEGQAPSSVNDCARQMMASVRTWYEDAQWINWGDTTVYVASTQFKIVGVNVTSRYIVGRRVRAVGSTTGTIYGTITVSSFSTDTTVTVSWDSGSLSNETLTISIGILTPTNVVFPSPFLAGIGLVTAPAFSFTADPNTGMYSSTADNLDFACGGARQLKLSGSASAVNYPRLSGAVTGSYVTLAAEGSDTNTGINFIAKGNAGVSFNTNGSSANTQVFISHTASPVNYVNLTGAATAGTPTISVLGSDTNIDLTLAGKGSGVPKAPTASPGANTTQIATTAFVTAAVASAGTVKQVVRSSTTTGSDLTTTVPLDNTIVQNTEGTEVLTQAITPTSGSSVLKIVVNAYLGGMSSVVPIIGALFVDSTADALASQILSAGANNDVSGNFTFIFYVSAASTSARTYKFRIGPSSAATVYFNKNSSGQLFGGTSYASIEITETSN